MKEFRSDPYEPELLKGEELRRAIEGFARQADENFEVSKEIQLRDGVDSKGRKIRRGK